MAITLDGTNGYKDTGTGALGLPSGTTEERPTSPANGYMRFNKDTKSVETYINGSWVITSRGSYLAEVLIVAGGGSGGGTVANHAGGGGGAGGVVYVMNMPLTKGITYSVIVGAGAARPVQNQQGISGNNSSFNDAIAIGGGYGQGQYSDPVGMSKHGGSGGSGGGSGGHAYQGTYGIGGAGTFGQGNAGGYGSWNTHFASGGGGGAGSVGGNGRGNYSGDGGIGTLNAISESFVHYAGGGGGGGCSPGGHSSHAASGGLGGGSNGAVDSQAPDATANLGGGGGGATHRGGAGGSGVVIIKYPGSARATGGSITSTGLYTIHTFTTSDTFKA